MTNTINTQKANEIKVNGNCKKVKDITNNIDYISVKEAAKANNVSFQAMSYAIRHETVCNGNLFVFEKDLYKSGDKLCAENAKANKKAAKESARANRAEARVAEMEAEMAEFRKWKAEQEAKRIAEEKARKEEEARLERERKEEEKRQAKITKLEDKIERLETLIDRNDKTRQKLVGKRNKALEELKALNNGKEAK